MNEANWADASLQEVFDHVAGHLLSQGERAVGDLDCCELFVSKTNHRCAYGCLLPVEYYKNNSERNWWTAVADTGIDNDDARETLMDELMYCHDNINPINWPNTLLGIAKHYKLKFRNFYKPKEVSSAG